MSTAAFPGVYGPVRVKRSSRLAPKILTGGAAPARAYLTIRRITETHHGRTLLMLGHAAEHLANSRRFQVEEIDASEAEAMHILMGLSRSVFDEFAEMATGRNGGSNSGWLGGYLSCSDSCVW